MFQTLLAWIAMALAANLAAVLPPRRLQSPSPSIGIVIMHGKGESPDSHVSDLASSLEARSYLVINLEMPFGPEDASTMSASTPQQRKSKRRSTRCGSRGAKRLFVSFYSLGALFALYFVGKQSVDGVITRMLRRAAASSAPIYREKLGESVEIARRLIAEGKANEKSQVHRL